MSILSLMIVIVMLSTPEALSQLKLRTMALSPSAVRDLNSKGVCVVWLKKSVKIVVEGEI